MDISSTSVASFPFGYLGKKRIPAACGLLFGIFPPSPHQAYQAKHKNSVVCSSMWITLRSAGQQLPLFPPHWTDCWVNDSHLYSPTLKSLLRSVRWFAMHCCFKISQELNTSATLTFRFLLFSIPSIITTVPLLSFMCWGKDNGERICLFKANVVTLYVYEWSRWSLRPHLFHSAFTFWHLRIASYPSNPVVSSKWNAAMFIPCSFLVAGPFSLFPLIILHPAAPEGEASAGQLWGPWLLGVLRAVSGAVCPLPDGHSWRRSIRMWWKPGTSLLLHAYFPTCSTTMDHIMSYNFFLWLTSAVKRGFHSLSHSDGPFVFLQFFLSLPCI